MSNNFVAGVNNNGPLFYPAEQHQLNYAAGGVTEPSISTPAYASSSLTSCTHAQRHTQPVARIALKRTKMSDPATPLPSPSLSSVVSSSSPVTSSSTGAVASAMMQ